MPRPAHALAGRNDHKSVNLFREIEKETDRWREEHGLPPLDECRDEAEKQLREECA